MSKQLRLVYTVTYEGDYDYIKECYDNHTLPRDFDIIEHKTEIKEVEDEND